MYKLHQKNKVKNLRKMLLAQCQKKNIKNSLQIYIILQDSTIEN